MKSNDDVYYEVRIGTAMMVLSLICNLIQIGLLATIILFMIDNNGK